MSLIVTSPPVPPSPVGLYDSASIQFLPSGIGASATTVQAELQRVIYPEQYVQAGDANDYASINRALTLAKSSGAAIAVHLMRKAYEIGTNKISFADGASLIGKAVGGSFINATGGTGAILEVDSVTHVTVQGIRLGFGSVATQIGLNIKTTTADVRWCRFTDIEMAPSATVAGQKGVQMVASGGHIVTDNWFFRPNFFAIDQPIIETDTEGNWWIDFDIDTWGATASTNALNCQSHATFHRGRVAGIPAGGTGIAYKQSGSSNNDQLVVDIGAGQTALNLTGTRNRLDLMRVGGTTPIGTYVANNVIADAAAGMFSVPTVLQINQTADRGTGSFQVHLATNHNIAFRDAVGGAQIFGTSDAAGYGNLEVDAAQLDMKVQGTRVLFLNGTDVEFGKALVALGGGAAPTLGTIGGTGPATAGQNSWLRVLDSAGAAMWIPIWK